MYCTSEDTERAGLIYTDKTGEYYKVCDKQYHDKYPRTESSLCRVRLAKFNTVPQ